MLSIFSSIIPPPSVVCFSPHCIVFLFFVIFVQISEISTDATFFIKGYLT